MYRLLHSKYKGRLAPANFSPNCKYFDQILQTVKNETTVLSLVSESFLETSLAPLISILYAKNGISRFFFENFLSPVPRKFEEENFGVSGNFWLRKILCIIGGIMIFSRQYFVSQYQKTS